MRVRLLGTGSADGWPNPWCTCAACAAALRRGQLRVPTSALVDGRLLLDCGPETPRSALRHGASLAEVTHVLITHDHPDHSAPMALLARRWAGRTEPLTVVGPASVVAAWRDWTAPTGAPGGRDGVSFVSVSPGDELLAGSHRVRVLGAAHQAWELGDAVLYDVTSPDGERLLYATDTGPLPPSTRQVVAGAAYAVVLIEATFGDRAGPGHPDRHRHRDHLDLADLADELALLRACGAVTDRTDVVAVHLSHHSPPDLEPRLAALGARVVDEGTQLVVAPPVDGPDVGAPAALRAHRTLVVGGARSGKSHVAERLLAGHPVVTYVATGPAPSDRDPEWAQRVRSHRQRRPPHWTTVETTDLVSVLRRATTPVLVDCLGTWLTAVLDDVGAWNDGPGLSGGAQPWRPRFDQEVDELVEAWHTARVPVVAVSNEVGSGVVPATASGRLFRDELGRLATRLSLASERVLLVVAGRAIDVSGSSGGGPPHAATGGVTSCATLRSDATPAAEDVALEENR
jgi:adenosylcobinamide kinase/adenosylcobinamide-phosphate guanylyltransferase